MKLVLHVGCHKTGTGAIQTALRTNTEALSALGYHYALPRRGGESNAIADALHAGKTRTVARFFARHVAAAQRKGSHTVVVSAESFFGMSIVAALRHGSGVPDPAARDRLRVGQLPALIPAVVEDVKVVCYLRRPDRFAESWYNQNVKGSALVSEDFAQFLDIVNPLLRYPAFVNPWAAAFGKANCVVRNYEATSHDVLPDFAAHALGLPAQQCFPRPLPRHNERIDRDMLEFRRTLNQSITLREKPLEYEIMSLLAQRVPPRPLPPSSQDFMSPDERAGLLSSLAPDMEEVCERYGLPPFPPFDVEAARAGWAPYPGLDPDRYAQLSEAYREISGAWRFRLRRTALRLGFRPRTIDLVLR